MITPRIAILSLGMAIPLAAQQTPILPADTVAPAAAIESPYRVLSAGFPILGTLTLPRSAQGPVPVAVIIAGSGPTDRNGNSSLGIRPNAYAQLAWNLAQRGIASFRYDKRGIAASRGALDSAAAKNMVVDQFANDAKAAAESLHADRRFSRVVFVGHSEGASLAVRAANLGAPVAGVISVSGMGRRFGVVVRDQLAQQLDSATLFGYDTAMTAYLAGRDPAVPSYLQGLFMPVNRTYLRSLMAYDPPGEMARVRCPVLIVQGDMDFQISVRDADILHGALAGSREAVIPGMNHVLKHVASRDRAQQQAAYVDPTTPIDPAVVTTIAEWVGSLK